MVFSTKARRGSMGARAGNARRSALRPRMRGAVPNEGRGDRAGGTSRGPRPVPGEPGNGRRRRREPGLRPEGRPERPTPGNSVPKDVLPTPEAPRRCRAGVCRESDGGRGHTPEARAGSCPEGRGKADARKFTSARGAPSSGRPRATGAVLQGTDAGGRPVPRGRGPRAASAAGPGDRRCGSGNADARGLPCSEGTGTHARGAGSGLRPEQPTPGVHGRACSTESRDERPRTICSARGGRRQEIWSRRTFCRGPKHSGCGCRKLRRHRPESRSAKSSALSVSRPRRPRETAPEPPALPATRGDRGLCFKALTPRASALIQVPETPLRDAEAGAADQKNRSPRTPRKKSKPLPKHRSIIPCPGFSESATPCPESAAASSRSRQRPQKTRREKKRTKQSCSVRLPDCYSAAFCAASARASASLARASASFRFAAASFSFASAS